MGIVMKQSVWLQTFILIGCLVTFPALAPAQSHLEGSHGMKGNHPAERSTSAKVHILNKSLLNQEGHPVHFKTDVIGQNIVVMNFVYTTCTTQCPLNSQILSHVQQNLTPAERKQVRLVSLSIDPGTDTPERLKEYAEKIGAGPGWNWLTGLRPEVNELLDALGVYTPDFKSHPSVFLVGDGKTGNWTRFNGTPGPETLLSKVHQLMSLRQEAQSSWTPKIRRVSVTNAKSDGMDDKAKAYFTDLPVITHDGQQVRFYSDLLKNKIVLINLFYGKCENSCPMVHTKLSKLQTILEDYMGKSVFFLSITIDPEPDTPEALAKYAQNFKPGKGWKFVTGDPAHIKTITRKLGQTHDEVKSHAPFMMVGDVKKARWKKIMPNVPDKALALFLRKLASDPTY